MDRGFDDEARRRLLAVLLFLYLAMSSWVGIVGVDVGFHIRTGERVVQDRAIPSVNTFSYTHPDHEWLLQQWLPATLFYLADRWGGMEGVVVFKTMICLAALGLTWLTATRLTGRNSYWPFWSMTLMVLMARMRFFARPYLLSALLFALLLYLDRKYGRRRQWQLIGLPLLMTLWANLHAGVLYGFALLGARAAAEWIEWGGRRYRRLGWTGLRPPQNAAEWRPLLIRPIGAFLGLAGAVLSVELINPNGARVLWVPISMFLDPFWQNLIKEFQTPTWTYETWFFVSVPVIVLLQALDWRRRRMRWLLPWALFAFLALRSQRSILFYALLSAPYTAMMAAHLSRRFRRPWRRAQTLHRVALPAVWALLIFFYILQDGAFRFGFGYFRYHYPMELIGFLKEKVPKQNMFHAMRLGGPLLWHLYPKFRPFIDGRLTCYPKTFWEDEYLPAASGKPKWKDVFDQHNVQAVLMPFETDRSTPALSRQLFADEGWALVRYNDHAALFLKRDPLNQALIQEHEFQYLWPGDWSFSKMRKENFNAAVREARRALEIAPDSLFARAAGARALMIAGDYAGAATLYRQILEDPEMEEDYWRDYGYALFMDRRFEEAATIFDAMIRREVEPDFAWFLKHRIAVERNRLERADRFLDQALALDPDNEKYREARRELDERLEATPP